MWDNSITKVNLNINVGLTKKQIQKAKEIDARMQERTANALRFLKIQKPHLSEEE